MNNANGFSCMETEYIRKHHKHQTVDNQCSSALVKHIKAPVHLPSDPYTLGDHFRGLTLEDPYANRFLILNQPELIFFLKCSA
ncbi:hypothetical protein CsSME_00023559 [Camellia sinensis var. sinensis]